MVSGDMEVGDSISHLHCPITLTSSDIEDLRLLVTNGCLEEWVLLV
jgi:hypothetical protein